MLVNAQNETHNTLPLAVFSLQNEKKSLQRREVQRFQI